MKANHVRGEYVQWGINIQSQPTKIVPRRRAPSPLRPSTACHLLKGIDDLLPGTVVIHRTASKSRSCKSDQ